MLGAPFRKENILFLHSIALNPAHAFTIRTVALAIERCVKISAFCWQAQSRTRQKNENDDEADEECYIDDDDDDQDDGGDDSELLYSCI